MFQATNDARDLLVMYENLLEKYEALNFRYVRELRRVECDDPEIWVEDYGTGKDTPREFVLFFHGRGIGFGGPEAIVSIKDAVEIVNAGKSEVEKIPAAYEGMTWVIGQIGQEVGRYDSRSSSYVRCAEAASFDHEDERVVILSLINAALSEHRDALGSFTQNPARVIFLPEVFAHP